MIFTVVRCNDCPNTLTFEEGYCGRSWDVNNRVHGKGWGDSDGVHLCPDCTPKDPDDAGDRAHDLTTDQEFGIDLYPTSKETR